MSAVAEERKHVRSVDSPIVDRPVSSISMLDYRLGQVHRAYRAGDTGATRGELRRLAEEATLLAKQPGLVPSLADNRLRIAVEKDHTPRAGS